MGQSLGIVMPFAEECWGEWAWGTCCGWVLAQELEVFVDIRWSCVQVASESRNGESQVGDRTADAQA